MDKRDIHNRLHQLGMVEKRILKDPDLTERSKKLILKFRDACRGHGLSVDRRPNLERRTIFRNYKIAKRRLGLPTIQRNPDGLINFYSSRLGLKPLAVTAALKIIKSLKYSDPRVGACAAIYMVYRNTRNPVTLAKFKREFGVCEASIRGTVEKNFIKKY